MKPTQEDFERAYANANSDPQLANILSYFDKEVLKEWFFDQLHADKTEGETSPKVIQDEDN